MQCHRLRLRRNTRVGAAANVAITSEAHYSRRRSNCSAAGVVVNHARLIAAIAVDAGVDVERLGRREIRPDSLACSREARQ